MRHYGSCSSDATFGYLLAFLSCPHDFKIGNACKQLHDGNSLLGILTVCKVITLYLRLLYFNSCCSFKRKLIQQNFKISTPIYKVSKYGLLTLALPSSLFWMDLSVCMDTHRNSGLEMYLKVIILIFKSVTAMQIPQPTE